MCCRTLLDPVAREVLKPTLLELCRDSFKQLLDKEKAAQAKQVGYIRGGGECVYSAHTVSVGKVAFQRLSIR